MLKQEMLRAQRLQLEVDGNAPPPCVATVTATAAPRGQVALRAAAPLATQTQLKQSGSPTKANVQGLHYDAEEAGQTVLRQQARQQARDQRPQPRTSRSAHKTEQDPAQPAVLAARPNVETQQSDAHSVPLSVSPST